MRTALKVGKCSEGKEQGQNAMQLEPHGSASAGTSSFAIQAHCFGMVVPRTEGSSDPPKCRGLGQHFDADIANGKTSLPVWPELLYDLCERARCTFFLFFLLAMLVCLLFFSCYSCLLFLLALHGYIYVCATSS